MLCHKIQGSQDVGRLSCFHQTGHLPPESLYSKWEKPHYLGSHLQSHTLGRHYIFCHTDIPIDPKARETLSRQKTMEINKGVYSDPLLPPTAQQPQSNTPDLWLPADDISSLLGTQGPHDPQHLCHIPTLCLPTCYSPNMWVFCAFAHAFLAPPLQLLPAQILPILLAHFTIYLHHENFSRPELSNKVSTGCMCYLNEIKTIWFLSCTSHIPSTQKPLGDRGSCTGWHRF